MSESTLVKMSNCWKSHAAAHISYLTPTVVCNRVHTPHMNRNVDIICDLTRSRSPAHISLATIKGMEIVELMLSKTC